MKKVSHIGAYLKRVWIGVFFFTLFCSFAFHMVQGDRGYISYKNLKEQQLKKQAEYASLKATRVHLERRVKHLRPQSLDLDLLDEQARSTLYQMGENEFILSEYP